VLQAKPTSWTGGRQGAAGMAPSIPTPSLSLTDLQSGKLTAVWEWGPTAPLATNGPLFLASQQSLVLFGPLIHRMRGSWAPQHSG
jgi:hypothetical protein